MKTRILLFGLIVVLATAMVSAQTITSNGTGGGDWNTGTTWIGGVVPIITDNVVIQGGDVVTLLVAGTCANLTLNAAATLSLNATGLIVPGTSWTFSNSSNVIYNGPTTVQSAPVYGNLTYSSANGGPNGDLTVNGNLTITAATFRGIATTTGTRTITIGGNVIINGASARMSAVNNSSATSASCTYNITGNVSLTGNNSGNRLVCYESAGPHTGSAVFNIDGDLTIGTSSQLSIKSSTSTSANFPEGIINLKGNLVHNGLISILSVSSGTSPGLTINFVGASNQAWSGAGTYDTRIGFPINFNVNNSTGVTLAASKTLSAIAGASMVLSLTNGKLTTTNSNLLTIGSNASISGGSSSSFVDGPLAHTIASTSLTTKTFPIGKGTEYRPVELAITQGAATSTTYTAEVFNAAPVSNTIPGTLGPVLSTVRYWNIVGNPVTAITSSTVKLSYDASDGVTDFENLKIAQGPSTGGGAWVNLGGAGTANTTGTITSTEALTDYSTNTVYTLAQNTIGTNALPVEITSFKTITNGKNIELLWNTATELNNMGFEIERRHGSVAWTNVGFVEGNGTSNVPHSYSFVDKVTAPAKYQYRLKQIDRNGQFEYSPTIEASPAFMAEDYSLSQNYPNPFNPATTFSFAMKHAELTTVKVYNLVGQEVAILFNAVAQPDQLYSLTFEAKNLPSGIYFYALRSSSRNEVKKMSLIK